MERLVRRRTAHQGVQTAVAPCAFAFAPGPPGFVSCRPSRPVDRSGSDEAQWCCDANSLWVVGVRDPVTAGNDASEWWPPRSEDALRHHAPWPRLVHGDG